MQDQSLTDAAGRLRHFSRFYTREIGVLDRHLLGSGHSLSEARVLYELAHNDQLTASDFVWKLGIDGGYLSRMLNAFEKDGLITKRPSQTDRRVSYLALTEKGRAAYAKLDRLSQSAAEALLQPLGGARRRRLVSAMHEVEAMFGEARQAEAVSLRPHRVGDMGWIVHRQAVLYAEDYGWDIGYEALIAEIVAKFVRDFDPAREHCWVAELAGETVGSVFLVRESDEVAKLRLLYVEKSARGLGIGKALVGACVDFARAKGYARLDLWTQSILADACRLYAAAGFRLVREEPHRSFGHDLVGQFWSLDLRPA